MELDKVRLRTYRQVWVQERVIYQIERIRLPFPVSFRQAGIFGITAMVMTFLSRTPGIGATPPMLRYVVIPGAVTWFLTRQRLDGKSPARWLLSMLRYLLSPKRLNRFRPIPPTPERMRFGGTIGYRVKG